MLSHIHSQTQIEGTKVMRYTTIAAALVAAMFTTQAKAEVSADENLAMMVTSASLTRAVCPGYTATFEEVVKSKPALFDAINAALLRGAGEPYNAVDLVPSISRVVDVALRVTTAAMKSNKALACKELGDGYVRAGLLKRT